MGHRQGVALVSLVTAFTMAACSDGGGSGPDAVTLDGLDVDGGAGRVDAGPDAVRVDAGRPIGWSLPAPVEDESAPATSVEVAADGAGNVVAAWLQGDTSATTVRTRRHLAGGDWEAQVPLEGGETRPALAMNASGDAVLAWTATLPNDGVVAAARRGGSWQPAVFLGASYASDVSVAACDDGSAVAVWSQRRAAGGLTMVASRTLDGTTWSAPAPIGAAVSGVRMFSGRVVAVPGGGVRAVWVQDPDGSGQVVVSAAMTGAAWGAIDTVGATWNYGAKPVLAADSTGRTTVVWTQAAGAIEHVHARRHTPGAGWDDDQVADATTLGALAPWVAAASSGEVLAVWAQKESMSAFGLYGRRRTEGGAWEAPIRIGDGGAGVFTTQVAFDSAGNAQVIWDRKDPASELVEIWGAARPAGAGWDGEGNLSDLGSSGHDPRLAFGGTWSGVVTWEVEDTNGRTIYAAVLRR